MCLAALRGALVAPPARRPGNRPGTNTRVPRGGSSHAGSGTLLATLARGLPQLCLPGAADQFESTETCVSAGADRALLPGSIPADRWP